MKIASLADVKAKFSAYVKDSDRGPVVITRNGKAVAAIIPLADDDDVERLALGYSPKLRSILDRARRRLRADRAVTHDQFWAKAAGKKRKTRR